MMEECKIAIVVVPLFVLVKDLKNSCFSVLVADAVVAFPIEHNMNGARKDEISHCNVFSKTRCLTLLRQLLEILNNPVFQMVHRSTLFKKFKLNKVV